MTNKIKVAIADDHALFRKGMLAILKSHKHLDVVGEANDGITVLELVAKKKPDVLLLDLAMPHSTGFLTIKAIANHYKDTKIIVVSMYDTDSHIVQAIGAGASGYLSKNADPDEILLAIESTHSVGFYLTDHTNKLMVERLYKKQKLLPVFTGEIIKLTNNEKDIIRGIYEELTNTEIADRLSLSARTVEGLRSELIQKLGVRNSVGIVLYGIRSGLLLA